MYDLILFNKFNQIIYAEYNNYEGREVEVECGIQDTEGMMKSDHNEVQA